MTGDAGSMNRHDRIVDDPLSPTKPAVCRSARDLWRAWSCLTWPERRATLSAAALIPTMAIGARLLSYERLLGLTERRPISAPKNGPPAEIVPQLARATRRASNNGLYHGNCLSRSLALSWLLRQRGIAAQVRLGARVTDGQLHAHAWVEHQGRVVNDAPDVATRFTPFRPMSDDPTLATPVDARFDE